MTSKWVRGTKGGFRCPHGCCHVGKLSTAKRGHARSVRRAARAAVRQEEVAEDAG